MMIRCVLHLFLIWGSFMGRLLKLKNVIPYSIYTHIAQLDLLNFEQVYEYETQLLCYVDTSHLMFWTLGGDI